MTVSGGTVSSERAKAYRSASTFSSAPTLRFPILAEVLAGCGGCSGQARSERNFFQRDPVLPPATALNPRTVHDLCRDVFFQLCLRTLYFLFDLNQAFASSTYGDVVCRLSRSQLYFRNQFVTALRTLASSSAISRSRYSGDRLHMYLKSRSRSINKTKISGSLREFLSKVQVGAPTADFPYGRYRPRPLKTPGQGP